MASAKKTTAKKDLTSGKTKPVGERRPGMMSGNLASDPELRFTQAGIAVASLYIAVNQRVQNNDGEWVDKPAEFHDIAVWRQQAERAVENLQKGDRIVAIGYWLNREYTDKEGEEHSEWEFTANEIGPSLLFRDAAPVRKVTRSKGTKSEPPF